MKNIELIEQFEFGKIAESAKNKEVRKIFDGVRRQIISIKLRNNEVLSKHKANEPLTIFCLAGNGKLLAGKNLDEKQVLTTGTFVTLEAQVEHEVVAEPELHILVTKFKEQ